MSKYPISIRPYLDEISNCIWNQNASIMVGAGFSMNAKELESNPKAKPFPSWQDLGNEFYKKVRGEEIKDAKYNFFDPLKLAYEVEASLGRPVLDAMLRDAIPDIEYAPSVLHHTLLKFPWVDVFTTNYDTLLDRAAKNVTAFNYKVVVNKGDLIHSTSPRIIKLHGCFSASTPLIISEEDYRTYPYKYAPFVNTVQQTLLENTLCLIGFSGDDPNFLKWIGWIRDNLGKENSPKIYLVGLLGLSTAQQKALDQYNITCVDMSLCSDVGDKEHSKGLEYFFDYVNNKKKDVVWKHSNSSGENDQEDRGNEVNESKRASLNEEYANTIKTPISPQIKNSVEDFIVKSHEVEKQTRKWQIVRDSYPNWLILPEKIRSQFLLRTTHWGSYLTTKDEITNKIKFEFIYEYLWRKEKCLLPIWDQEITIIIALVKHYTNELKNIGVANVIEKMSIEIVKEKSAFILLALCRYYREENKLNERAEYYKLAYELFNDSKYRNHIMYEKALQLLYDGNTKELTQYLREWDVNENTSFWMYKKAGLLSKINMLDEAKILLNKALIEIRKQINETTVITEYSSFSLESYVLVLLNYIENSIDYRRDIDEGIQSRLKFLKRYDCDPYSEIAYLENSISHEYVNNKSKSKKFGFDIGTYSEASNHIVSNNEANNGFHLLRFFEDTGIPYKINNTTFGVKGAENAIKRIADYAPSWAMSTMLQLQNDNAMKGFFTRERLDSMDFLSIDEIAKKYVLSLSELLDFDDSNSRIGHILPEALSRLCCKCSIEVKTEILNLLTRIYRTEHTKIFFDVKLLVRRLINSLENVFIIQHVDDFIELSYFYSLRINTNTFIHYFDNPFYNENFTKAIKQAQTKVSNKRIPLLLKLTKSEDLNERRTSLFTVISLYNLGYLNKKQHVILNSSLLQHVDTYGIPCETDYFQAAFNDVLIDKVTYQNNLKNYIFDVAHMIQDKQDNPRSYTVTNTFDPLCNEIILASRFIKWNNEEKSIIFNKLFAWWEADKKYLLIESKKDSFLSMAGEFKKRFALLPDVISCVLIEGDVTKQDILKQLLEDFKIHGLPHINLYTVISDFTERANVLSEISNSFTSEEDVILRDAFQAVFYLIKIENVLCEELLNEIFQYIKYNKTDNLLHGFNVLSELIKKNSLTFNNNYSKIISNVLIKINEGFTELSFNENLSLQKSAANIAYLISSNLKVNSNLEAAITIWNDRCISENEFSEIKNQWLIE